MPTPWYAIQNADEVPSPALLVYPDRVEENIRRMIALAGGVDRLRPHMKTSKIPEVVRMHLDQGITRYKVATDRGGRNGGRGRRAGRAPRLSAGRSKHRPARPFDRHVSRHGVLGAR